MEIVAGCFTAKTEASVGLDWAEQSLGSTVVRWTSSPEAVTGPGFGAQIPVGDSRPVKSAGFALSAVKSGDTGSLGFEYSLPCAAIDGQAKVCLAVYIRASRPASVYVSLGGFLAAAPDYRHFLMERFDVGQTFHLLVVEADSRLLPRDALRDGFSASLFFGDADVVYDFQFFLCGDSASMRPALRTERRVVGLEGVASDAAPDLVVSASGHVAAPYVFYPNGARGARWFRLLDGEAGKIVFSAGLSADRRMLSLRSDMAGDRHRRALLDFAPPADEPLELRFDAMEATLVYGDTRIGLGFERRDPARLVRRLEAYGFESPPILIGEPATANGIPAPSVSSIEYAVLSARLARLEATVAAMHDALGQRAVQAEAPRGSGGRALRIATVAVPADIDR